jgi:cell division protease FtsH
MGGRVSEKIVFGHVNSGAANDLEQATAIARRMVREWGMSDRVGPMAWSSQQHVFLGEDLMTSGREYSDDTAKLLDEEIARILTDQEQRATDLLLKHRRGLELVADALLEHETIDGREVAQLIQRGLSESGDSDEVTLNVTSEFEPDTEGEIIAPEPAPAPEPATLKDAPRILPRPAAGT